MARSPREWVSWAYHSWATRSLALGAIATVFDVGVLLLCVRIFHLPNPVGAMIGVSVGATFTFFANRHFAFKDHDPKLAPQALKFALSTGAAMLVHATFVYLLADRWGVPVVIAKLIADVAVFSVGQLLLLRYVVFPKKAPDQGPGAGPGSGPSDAGAPSGGASGANSPSPSTAPRSPPPRDRGRAARG